MSEVQPDMLGGKAVPGSRLRRIRRTGKAPIARDGWADKPGTGPEGETCGSCTYCEAFHYAKRYYKCSGRAGRHWQGGRATDIRPLDPACSKWAPSVNRANQQKAPKNEADRIADGNPAPCRNGGGADGPAIEPGPRHNPERGARVAPAGKAEQAPSRPQRIARDHMEDLQRAFEF